MVTCQKQIRRNQNQIQVLVLRGGWAVEGTGGGGVDVALVVGVVPFVPLNTKSAVIHRFSSKSSHEAGWLFFPSRALKFINSQFIRRNNTLNPFILSIL